MMITNFKIFENNIDDKKFWVVKNDENLKVRLFKIGMPDNLIQTLLKLLQKDYRTDRFFYVGYDEEDDWTYCEYNYTSGSNIYKEKNFKYMGHVDINDNDIYNYKVRDEIKKYNL